MAGDAAHAWAHCCSCRAMVDVWRLFSGPRTSEGEADVEKVETISGNADVNADSSGAGSMDPPTLVTPPSSDDEDGGGRRLDSPPPHPPTPFRELKPMCHRFCLSPLSNASLWRGGVAGVSGDPAGTELRFLARAGASRPVRAVSPKHVIEHSTLFRCHSHLPSSPRHWKARDGWGVRSSARHRNTYHSPLTPPPSHLQTLYFAMFCGECELCSVLTAANHAQSQFRRRQTSTRWCSRDRQTFTKCASASPRSLSGKI